MLHAPMFMFIANMSLQKLFSYIVAHMPSAYGLGKSYSFNKVQFSSVQFIWFGCAKKNVLGRRFFYAAETYVL